MQELTIWPLGGHLWKGGIGKVAGLFGLVTSIFPILFLPNFWFYIWDYFTYKPRASILICSKASLLAWDFDLICFLLLGSFFVFCLSAFAICPLLTWLRVLFPRLNAANITQESRVFLGRLPDLLYTLFAKAKPSKSPNEIEHKARPHIRGKSMLRFLRLKFNINNSYRKHKRN